MLWYLEDTLRKAAAASLALPRAQPCPSADTGHAAAEAAAGAQPPPLDRPPPPCTAILSHTPLSLAPPPAAAATAAAATSACSAAAAVPLASPVQFRVVTTWPFSRLARHSAPVAFQSQQGSRPRVCVPPAAARAPGPWGSSMRAPPLPL